MGGRSLEHLGHKIVLGKVEVPEARVKQLKDFKKPVKKRDLWAFLGTVVYYRRFIPDYARWAGPLNKALYKEATNLVQWDDRQVDCFNHLITVLCSASVLWLPRHDDHFILHTDASFQGVGAVLSAVRDGVERPVGFYSGTLTKTEKNYAATEIECLAIVKAVHRFAIDLLGCSFIVVTDHKALESLQSSGS